MSNPDSIPKAQLQPVAVDFVDRHLARFHRAFAQHRCKYNSNLDRYVRDNSLLSQVRMDSGIDTQLSNVGKPLSPPEIMLSMRFWDRVLPDAMGRLKEHEESKGRHQNYNIRGLGTWDEIYSQLEACRERYLYDQGWTKKVKRQWRTFTENMEPIQAAWNLVPDVDYLTPIRGVVDCIFEVRIAPMIYP